MAFLEHTNSNKPVEAFYELPATADEVYTPGEALAFNAAGTITKASGTTVPTYICQGATEDGKIVYGTLVNPEQELEVPLSAAGTSLKPGNKVTIGTDGLTVTATTTSGIFTITTIVGTAVGDTVRGYFLR